MIKVTTQPAIHRTGYGSGFYPDLADYIRITVGDWFLSLYFKPVSKWSLENLSFDLNEPRDVPPCGDMQRDAFYTPGFSCSFITGFMFLQGKTRRLTE